MADRMVARELMTINESGKIKNGILNPNDLEENERILLDKYMNYRVRYTTQSDKWKTTCNKTTIQ